MVDEWFLVFCPWPASPELRARSGVPLGVRRGAYAWGHHQVPQTKPGSILPACS